MRTVIARTYQGTRPRRPAHFVTADDGHHYYVKPPTAKDCFAKKVLGPRIAAFCGVESVETSQVVLDEEFVRNARAEAKTQDEREALRSGVHFGSQCPVNRATTAMYDLLPANLAGKIRNLQDFSVMRTVDVWIANPLSGHALFVRQPERDFRAHFVGFGQSCSFGEPERPSMSWTREFASLSSPSLWAIAVKAIDTVQSISRADLELMTSDIPSDWCNGVSIPTIIDQLLARQSTLGLMMMNLRREESGLPERKLVHVEMALAPSVVTLVA